MGHVQRVGGTKQYYDSANYVWGLSPHMRGSRPRSQGGGVIEGSIPAHAGEPNAHPACRNTHRVYPRACGVALSRVAIQTRSSKGSIPAHAGSPSSESSNHDAPRRGLSPRMRGRRSGTNIGISRCTRGVYPRACGGANMSRSLQNSWLVGSIPAHAGEPLRCWSSPSSPSCRVYPRACGGA